MNARGVLTAALAVVFLALGLALGALGSAWQSRATYAEPWQKMRVEREGSAGKPSHTRIIFQNPKLALQAIDLSSSSDGAPSSARVSLREGDELSLTFDEKGRPASIAAPDGSLARLAYESGRTRVTFVGADGTEVASKRMTVPEQFLVETAGVEAAADASSPGTRTGLGRLWKAIESAAIGEALAQGAQPAEDEDVSVVRDVPLSLSLNLVAGDTAAGTAQIETSCAPYPCVPSRRDLTAPGANDVSLTVTSISKKSSITPPTADQIEAQKTEARAERKAASKALPDMARIVGAVAITSMACKSAGVTAPFCVKELSKEAGVAGGAVNSLVHHVVENDASIISDRANKLYYEEAARAQVDKPVSIEVCVSRDGYARVCTKLDGRPFAAAPMDKTALALELRKGVGGTLNGTFVMTQADGADCKFSPSPRTAGVMKLTFDNEKNTATASMTANEHGTRANMGCSLGTANMSWAQNYSITATQTFTKEQMSAGGKLPLHLTGTMSGTGSYSFSNCRSSGGVSGACPGGKNDGYGYPVEVNGTLDLDSHAGSGLIVVSNAPLVTQGTWTIAAGAKP